MKHLFRKYFNSTLRPDEFQKVEEFVRDPKNESSVYREMKPLWDSSLQEETGLPGPNPVLMQKITDTILREKHKVSQRKIKIYTLGLKIAAVLIIGLLFSTVFFYWQSTSQFNSRQTQTIATPYGARTNITLPDGSIVWLNSGTTLSFPVSFGKIRSVKLIGEAYFEVKKNNHPFIVSTQYGEVEVKGTSFNVKAYSDDNSFETTLEEGMVLLKDKNQEDEVILHPGQKAVQTPQGFTVKNVKTRLYTSWKEGKLIFSKEPFPSFMKKLERWYNVKIKYDDPKLTSLSYTGTIEMESISEVMEMISKASPVTFSFDNKTRIFTIKPKQN